MLPIKRFTERSKELWRNVQTFSALVKKWKLTYFMVERIETENVRVSGHDKFTDGRTVPLNTSHLTADSSVFLKQQSVIELQAL